MSRLPTHLELNEGAALQAFAASLYQLANSTVVGVWLFGSKARGDFEVDSDLDLLIVLAEADWTIRDRIHLLAARVSLEYDVLINTHFLSDAAWARMARQHAALWQQVRHDGVPLSLNASSVARPSSLPESAKQPIRPSA